MTYEIVSELAESFGLPTDWRRKRPDFICDFKRCMNYVLRVKYELTLVETSKLMGSSGHYDVIYNVRKFNDLIETDLQTQIIYMKLLDKIDKLKGVK